MMLLLRVRLLLLLPMTTAQQELLLLGGSAGCPFLLFHRFIPAAQLILQLAVGRRHPVLIGLEEIAGETDGLYAVPAEVDQACCGKKESRDSIQTSMSKTEVEEKLYKRGALTERGSGRRMISVSSR